MSDQKQLIVVMGPSGCGKSSVASALARSIGGQFIEGDDFHPPENRKKMAAGRPLTDADRTQWLDALQVEVLASNANCIVLACSALTRYAQYHLRRAYDREVVFLLLDAPRDVLIERLTNRQGHFMPPSLLDSQLEALDTPSDAVVMDAQQSVSVIVAELARRLGYKPQEQHNGES